MNFILLQEHWLLDGNLDKLDNIDNRFTNCSVFAMTNKVASGLMTGRPFGGVSLLWNKRYSASIKVGECDKEEGSFISILLKLNSGTQWLSCTGFNYY